MGRRAGGAPTSFRWWWAEGGGTPPEGWRLRAGQGVFSKRPVGGTKQVLSSSASNNFWMFQGQLYSACGDSQPACKSEWNSLAYEIAWRSKHPYLWWDSWDSQGSGPFLWAWLTLPPGGHHLSTEAWRGQAHRPVGPQTWHILGIPSTWVDKKKAGFPPSLSVSICEMGILTILNSVQLCVPSEKSASSLGIWRMSSRLVAIIIWSVVSGGEKHLSFEATKKASCFSEPGTGPPRKMV